MLRFRIPKRTYVRWLRESAPGSLERADRAFLYYELHRRKQAPGRAAELDRFVGKLVRLREPRTRYDGERVELGSPFYAFDAFCWRLYCVAPNPAGDTSRIVAIALAPEWVRLDISTPFVVVDEEVRGPAGLSSEARWDSEGLEEGPSGVPEPPSAA